MPERLDAFTGPAAGLLTSVLWTATSLFFTAAARRIGPVVLNAFRISFAVLLLGVTHRCLSGAWLPEAVERQVVLLALSGVIGLSIGDQALFVAFLDIGPRLAMLIMTTAPLFAALFGWLALGETLHGLAWLAMILTIAGVAWVVLERPRTAVGERPPNRLRGAIMAFVGAACQAGGLLLSKQGMGHGWLPEEQHMPPQTATLIRMFFAALAMLPILALYGRWRRRRAAAGVPSLRAGTRRAGFLLACCGAVTGPFLGVWMSLVASDRAPLAVAQTLCSLPPILILPFAVLVYHEHLSPRAVVGAAVAVAGTAMLFLQPP